MEQSLTKWKPKRKYRQATEDYKARQREKYGVITAGTNIPCLIKRFRSMRFPKVILQSLKSLDIHKPTSLQKQGFPVVLQGRETLLLSISRQGKTLIFLLPTIIGAIEEELRLPLLANEGPIGLIIAPSRELAYQIYSFARSLLHSLQALAKIKVILCTGGVDMQAQLQALSEGVHIVISTPGRLSDMLSKGHIQLKLCKILVLDEADRLLDLGFDEEVRSVLSHTTHNLQVVLSSSTMPKRMQEFASHFMKSPIYISSNKESLKNLKLTQVCELVPVETKKIVKLLEVMQRTEPPILIFCENKNESDMIQEYLSARDIECASLHGGKIQNARSRAIKDFNSGDLNVLIATDMAAKGLSFHGVKHVINYDMPKDIDAYIQRICRAARKALISNLLSYKIDKAVLSNLADFLVDMKEKVPEFLLELLSGDPDKCDYCNIKGHRRSSCGLLQQDLLKTELPLII